MPDIAMCEGTDCPLRENCKRFMSEPDSYSQSYMSPPYKDGKCDFYWPLKEEKLNVKRGR